MEINRKRVAKRLVSGLVAGALALGGLALSGGTASAKTPTSPSTYRIAGDDRYETAVEIARRNIPGDDPEVLIIASGESYADALAAAPLANGKRTAILLVREDSIPEAVADYLSDIRAGFVGAATRSVFIIGGTSVISTDVEDSIKSTLVPASDLTPALVARKAGDDRYGTAKAIGDTLGVTSFSDRMILVGGDSWADALAAGALAAHSGWPIALVPPAGIASNASAKAMVDGYLAIAGSAKQFVIFGGPAAVPSSVEEYLVGTKSVDPANVRRIAGADRYMTSVLANVYLLNEYSATAFTGSKVALASGEAPWDALGASAWAAGGGGIHIVLTPTLGGNVMATTLAQTLAFLSSESTVGLIGDELYVLGGKAAVSDSAKTGFIAAMNNDLTSTLSGCDASRSSLTLTLSGALSAAEHLPMTQAIKDAFTLNGVAMTGVTVSAQSLPVQPQRTIFTVRISGNTPPTLSAAQTVRFLGVDEDSTGFNVAGGDLVRSIAGSSCVVASDLTDPAVVAKAAWSGIGGNTSVSAFVHLKFSEPVTVGASGLIAAGGISLQGTSQSNVSPATVSAMAPGDGTEYLIRLAVPATETGIPNVTAGAIVSISASAFTDLAGRSPAGPITVAAAADATPATLTALGTRCARTADATATSGVSITMINDLKGAAGNAFTLSVTNQRGLLIPTVTVDTTAKTISVVADTSYHTSNDIATVMQNNLLANAVLGDFAVSGGITRPVATAAPVRATGGRSTCQILISASEPVAVGTMDDASGAINNVPLLSITDAREVNWADGAISSTVNRTATVITVVTSELGTGSILFGTHSSGIRDIRGANSALAVSFTAS